MAGTGSELSCQQAVTSGRVPGELSRGARLWRVSLTAVWLVYLIEPLSGLFGHHHARSTAAAGWRSSGRSASSSSSRSPNWTRRTGAPCSGSASCSRSPLAACIIYGGSGATTLWIFVSAIAGLLVRSHRTALGVLALSAACYVVSSFTGHVDMADFLINLLPVVFLGLAMIGLRDHFELTRELAGRARTWRSSPPARSGCGSPATCTT